MARKVLNYSVRFYMFTIPFLMAYSISDNTTFSATRKIVSYHCEMALPCIASSFLSLFSPFSVFLCLTCRQPHQIHVGIYKRIPDINFSTSAPHSVAENASRSIDILGRYFRQFSKLFSMIKSSDWDAINIILLCGGLLALLIAISNLNVATYVIWFFGKY